jgi:uncharacterized protein YjbJ (UPF0337 family)
MLAKQCQLHKGVKMNADQIKGNWKQFIGKAKEKWGRLTDDDWKVVEGKRDQLVGKIQERYGITREEAERQLGDFQRTHERVWRTNWAAAGLATL